MIFKILNPMKALTIYCMNKSLKMNIFKMYNKQAELFYKILINYINVKKIL